MADKQSSQKTIEFLNALARGEKPKTSDQAAVDYLLSLTEGEEGTKIKRKALEDKKNNPLMQG